MADLGEVLGGALVDVGEPPGSTRALIRSVGDREAVRVLAGMNGPPARPSFASAGEYEQAHRDWRSASRRVQRAREVKPKGGQQSRGGSDRAKPLTPDQASRWKDAAEQKRLRAFFRSGARLRITARVRIDTPDPRKRPDTRVRTMPAGPGGVFIRPEVMDRVVEAAERGADADAEGMLLMAFAEGYDVEADLFEFEAVTSVTVWPEFTREPGR